MSEVLKGLVKAQADQLSKVEFTDSKKELIADNVDQVT